MLIDFGIAREYVAGQTTTMSASGMLTPGYSPPEQYYTQVPNISQEKTASVTQSRQRYRGTDPRSDIYALGATLFALLTGKVPVPKASSCLVSTNRTHASIRSMNLLKILSVMLSIKPCSSRKKIDLPAHQNSRKRCMTRIFLIKTQRQSPKTPCLARRRKESVLRAILTMIVMAVVFVGGVILFPILFPASTVSADLLTGLAQTQVSNNATSAALNAALLDAENSATLDVLGGMATAMASTSSSNESTQAAIQRLIDETATQASYQALTNPASGTKTALARRTSTGTRTPTRTPTITSTATPMTAPDLVIDRVDLVGPAGSCVNLPITYTYRITVYNQGTGDANNFTVNAFGTMRSISMLKAGQSTVLVDIVKQSSTIMADFYDEVQESNENNNAYIGNLITPTAPVTCTPTKAPTLVSEFGIGSTKTSDVDGMEMVYVPAGTFTMGSSDGEDNEQPVHEVYLDSYWMDKYEVTNAQYKKCVTDGSCGIPSSTTDYADSSYANHPVAFVSWYDAQDYCTWARRRLPTEAEWEKAARGTDGRTYPWGNESPSASLLNYEFYEGGTTIVGIYPGGASLYGVLDMAGNVYEWAADWYDAEYYSVSPDKNPTGPATGDGRVWRGGAWTNEAWYVRAVFRDGRFPLSTYHGGGFRCASSH